MAKGLVAHGTSIRQAARDFSLSETTLWRHIEAEKREKPAPKKGTPISLPEDCEKELSLILSLKSKWGFALNGKEVKELVKEFRC